MNFEAVTNYMERYITPLATKLSKQRHLRAIRDTFMSILPITLFGSIPVILASAPEVSYKNSNWFLTAWSSFAKSNALTLTWISAVTLNAMSLAICIGVTFYLSKHYNENPLHPMLFSTVGFLMLVLDPKKLGWSGNVVDISYWDGRGIIIALFISILTVESYHWMRKKNIGRISMPDSVPASLSETFAMLVPSIIILSAYTLLFIIFHAMNTTMVKFLYTILAPSFKAADSLPIAILLILLVHVFWFFGLHDAALAGILGPIRDGNLSINAAEKMSGQPLSRIFTTPYWTYFVIIGGSGSVLALAFMMMRSKSKQLRTVGKVGLIPSFFGISEPLIFGTPLMLNPVFFFPFIFTSVLNGIVTYLCMQFELINKTFAAFSWQIPAPFGAFLSTMDWKAVVLVIILIFIDGAIYYPFFKVYERDLTKIESEESEENKNIEDNK